MENTRYQKGLEKLMEFNNQDNSQSETHLKIVENLKDIAPDVSRYMIEFSYVDIYSRQDLSKKEQVLITLSSLVTQGALPQVEVHINAGLNIGLTPNEIIGSFIHLLSYIGFPKVLNAIEIAKKVFEENGIVTDIEE